MGAVDRTHCSLHGLPEHPRLGTPPVPPVRSRPERGERLPSQDRRGTALPGDDGAEQALTMEVHVAVAPGRVFEETPGCCRSCWSPAGRSCAPGSRWVSRGCRAASSRTPVGIAAPGLEEHRGGSRRSRPAGVPFSRRPAPGATWTICVFLEHDVPRCLPSKCSGRCRNAIEVATCRSCRSSNPFPGAHLGAGATTVESDFRAVHDTYDYEQQPMRRARLRPPR